MRVNVKNAIDRDIKLSQLDDRADALHDGAKLFESSAAKLKNKYWWKNCKVCDLLCLAETKGALITRIIKTGWLRSNDTLWAMPFPHITLDTVSYFLVQINVLAITNMGF